MKVNVSKEVLASINSLSVGASKDDVTPVIQNIALVPHEGGLRAMATDRYVVFGGHYLDGIEFDEWPADEVVTINPKPLKQVVDMVKATKFVSMPIEIEHDQESKRTFAIVEGSTKVDITGNYGTFPPVGKLLTFDSEPNGAPVLALKPDFLAKLAKVLPPEMRPDRERVWTFEFRSDNKPVYASYGGGERYKMEALLQPNLLKR